jgi:CDP-2,3-bis-(O-geranylgeranyl)-sn-glycerol synthase
VRVLELLYFMAPAYVANMAPPFVRYWKGWNRPISRRWLGSHKTVVGFGAGVLGAVLVTWLQARLDWDRAIVDYDRWLDLGVRMGAGAMLGDSVKSFFKRRRRVAPGGTWIPFDQLDFVLGALILVWPRAALAWTDVAIVIALSFAGHIVVNHLGYWLGVRDAKW